MTRALVFGILASTTYDLLSPQAIRFSTVDEVPNGRVARVACNIVTPYLDSVTRNLGLSTQVEHDERYRIADEYTDAVHKLWEESSHDDEVWQLCARSE